MMVASVPHPAPGVRAVVLETRSVAERRAALVRLAAEHLDCDPGEVAIAHEPGQPPRLLAPRGRDLHLSSASRGSVAALACSFAPVGIDLERVDPDIPPPWLVLHPAETAALSGLPAPDRARAFARLWSVKEAYLKALGIGLGREPGTFAVHLGPGSTSLIEDDRESVDAEAVTSWREGRKGGLYAVTTVLLRPSQKV